MKNFSINDLISIGNALIGVVPKLMTVVGFFLLVVLLLRSAKTWRTLSTLELAGIVIAFALVVGR